MKWKIGAIAAIAVAVLCCIYIFGVKAQTENESAPYKGLTASVEYTPNKTENEEQKIEQIKKWKIDFGKLCEVNKDTFAWICDGNEIDYPIVSTTDEEYYLTHDINGEENRVGTLFAVSDIPMQELDNIVIYGHNMGKGRTDMFSTLLRYKDSEYYEKNKYFTFETDYGEVGKYEIIAAFGINIYDDDFDYIVQTFSNEKAYRAYVDEAASRTEYLTSMPEQRSKLITLSTCDRSIDTLGGRFVVVAVKVE